MLGELGLLARSRPFALLGEGRGEALAIDRHAVLGRELDGEVDREAVRVMEAEGDVTREHRRIGRQLLLPPTDDPLRPGQRDEGLLELGRARIQRARELGLVDSIGDLRSTLRERYGDQVWTPLIADRGFLGRRTPGVDGGLGLLRSEPGLAEDFVSVVSWHCRCNPPSRSFRRVREVRSRRERHAVRAGRQRPAGCERQTGRGIAPSGGTRREAGTGAAE